MTTTVTVKEQIILAIQSLPDDAEFEDAIEQIYLLSKIEQGFRDLREGRVVSHEEMRERIKQWRS